MKRVKLTLILSCLLMTGCIALLNITGCTHPPFDKKEINQRPDLSFISLLSNEDYDIESRSGNLWMVYKKDDTAVYEFMIGGAGAISQLRWSPDDRSLLSPSYASEHTDRVIQTTWWSNTILCNTTSGPEKRWNVTQAGDGEGEFSPTNGVKVNHTNHTVDVYSYVQNQFTAAYDTVLHGGFRMLTRYTGLTNGVVEVRRIMIATQPDSAGVIKQHQSMYVEGWTPFLSASGTFNGLALSLDSTGSPNWWYLADYNIPTYQNLDVEETKGYAVVFNTSAISNGVYAAWIFGNQQVNNVYSGFYAFNSMNWNNGIGVLPGLNFTDFTIGAVIDQTFYLHVGSGMNSSTGPLLDNLVTQLPSVHVYDTSAVLPGDLSDLVDSINLITTSAGTRTEQLASLATGL